MEFIYYINNNTFIKYRIVYKKNNDKYKLLLLL